MRSLSGFGRAIKVAPARVLGFFAALAIAVSLVVTPVAAASTDETLAVSTAKGRATITAEIADDPTTRAHGLMFRESLPQNHGMLFDFGTSDDVSFWMKNTPLSLDMIFIREDGTVARVVPNTVPYSTTAIPSGDPVRFVLELEAGSARRLGIVAGTRLTGPRFAADGQ